MNRSDAPFRRVATSAATRLTAFLLLSLVAAFAIESVQAQTAAVRGFVTSDVDGTPLGGATVALYEDDADVQTPRYGAITTSDGLYLIRRVEPGAYLLEISFVGYESYRETLRLEAGRTYAVTVSLGIDLTALEELIVEEERVGMAGLAGGRETIRPEQIRMVPSPDLSGDLVSYLGMLPGVISTGDQGGQLFVRGGEPTQNLVLLDGMYVYQPFHLLGFYSVFPAEVINRVDFHGGGFGSRYGTRLSSVIDVATRSGNNRRYAGMVSLSPFTGATRLEGPIVPGKMSFLISGRESLIDEGAARYIHDDMPFRFGDAYAKVHTTLIPGAQVSVMGLRTHDRGTIGEESGGRMPEDIYWRNEAIGLRALMLPRIFPVVVDLHVSHSRLRSDLGPPDNPIRSSEISNTRLALEGSFPGERTNVLAGWEAVFTSLSAELGGLYQNVSSQERAIVPGAFYAEWDFLLRPGMRLVAGGRAQFHNVRLDPYLEPRASLMWERGNQRFSVAAGIYHQELVGVGDRRDAAGVFTAWTTIPRALRSLPDLVRFPDPHDPSSSVILPSDVAFPDDVLARRIGRAYHGVLGYGNRPTPWLELSIEGFYKEISNLFVAEWTPLPRLTTRLHPASGRSAGLDTRVELRRGPFHVFVAYGLSSTRYTAKSDVIELWYGTDEISFRPPHDRRHQLNALVSISVAGFDLSTRWEFGSGFPYTRPRGYDGFVPIDDVDDVFGLPHSRRAVYEEPFAARMPAYHRLDVSVERTFRVPGAAFTLQGSVINLYDRRNVFYYDTFTLHRVDQLPMIPSMGLRVSIE